MWGGQFVLPSTYEAGAAKQSLQRTALEKPAAEPPVRRQTTLALGHCTNQVREEDSHAVSLAQEAKSLTAEQHI
jgi:hypothetical protein